jgi:hypothetical protein
MSERTIGNVAGAVARSETAPEHKSAPRWHPPSWLDTAVRLLGFMIALLLAALSAAFEAFLTPLYWGSTRFPVSLVAAMVGNFALVYFTYVVTGRRLAAVGPALVWVVVLVAAASRTGEGDLVLTDSNWVGIATMLAGSIAFAVAGYRLVLTGVRPRPTDPSASAAAPPSKSEPGQPG